MCGCLFESRFRSCVVNIKDIQLGQLFVCDLHHELSYQRLNQTFDTCLREHGSFLGACYKLTTPATVRKSSRVPLVTCRRHRQHPYQRWMATLRSHVCKHIACDKTVGSKKTYTAKCRQLLQT